MERLVELADKKVSISSTKQDVIIHEKEFLNFMKLKPICEFVTLSRDSYLNLISDEKANLLNRFYLFLKSNLNAGVKLYSFFVFVF